MKKYYFYTSNQENGKTYPVVKDEKDQLMMYDCDTKKPLSYLKKQIPRCRDINESQLVDFCEKINVNTLDELCIKAKEYEELRHIKIQEESNFHSACAKVVQFENCNFISRIPMTYKETKAMGCTDIVYWEGETLTNPKTRNEFFSHQDAVSLLENKKQEYLETYKDEGEIDLDTCYIWEEAARLDDLIWEEENNPKYLP